MSESRTFTGDIRGLEVGSKFVVVVSSGNRPHRDQAYLGNWAVTRREEHRVTAVRTIIRIDEDVPWFETYTSKDDAPLKRKE